ncbi:MAG TPA: hypothetical protein DD381_00260 [Lentisphaeria bacterium]|nr:MAG: hypothetical protein A2X47_05985 [Lentisphaerae bacterium GWF2_38_69]HBM14774.1 hypothetical protein [Lentisphaeria bacterium]
MEGANNMIKKNDEVANKIWVRIIFIICFLIITLSLLSLLYFGCIALSIMIFSLISIIYIVLYFLFCLIEKRVDSNNMVRILILPGIILLIPSLLLIQKEYNMDLSPLWALFGTIVGYLLGKFDKNIKSE